MYLQRCEEYFAGKLMGADEENELYKGVVSFMVAGLKETVSYVVKAVPETKISAQFLHDHILECLKILEDSGFNVRVIVSDNHTSNVSSFNLLLKGEQLIIKFRTISFSLFNEIFFPDRNGRWGGGYSIFTRHFNQSNSCLILDTRCRNDQITLSGLMYTPFFYPG